MVEGFSIIPEWMHVDAASRYHGTESAPWLAPRCNLERMSPARMTPVIAFFNQKGGTAQTTSTLNVAAALAERGRRVLTLDLDPQASLSMAIGTDVANLDLSVYDLLLDDEIGVEEVTHPTTIAGIDIVPSHPDLAAAELE